ncbi:MAG TPA: NAD(P)/FAD-dependent oxidoreductase [Anaerolineales bacterium]|nr:NAD(P)/FAD-dependent oxidoreductase [Anaerolineales bacterium]
MNNTSQRPKVVIVGAGFGGIFAARTLEKKPVDVLLVDANNYHTFTPLLYQVATCALDPSEIAYPIRGIFRDSKNVDCMMGRVVSIDRAARTVTIRVGEREVVESYDYLILSAGSVPTYFGNDHLRANSFELRTLDDAVKIRNHILRQFEQAVWMPPSVQREAMATIVVVGGGPTGLETAGALYELYNHVLGPEFGVDQTLPVRVMLVEKLEELLRPYPDKLSQAALDQLRSLGVEVVLGVSVEEITNEIVRLEDGTEIPTRTVIWTAGVKAAPAAEHLGVELTLGGALPVTDRLSLVEDKRIYAVGDNAYLEDPQGQPYPMLIPVAKQQGILAAKNILREIEGAKRQAFVYHDRGIMATIGRSRAVAWIYNRIPMRGFTAWVAWLFLHLLSLMGFRNKLNVLINWTWNYLTYDRSVRVVLD